MTNFKRRAFLQNSALLLGSGALSTTMCGYAFSGNTSGWRLGAGYGALALSNDAVTGLPLIKLPPGFYYRSLAYAGLEMDDGVKMPDSFDGMGVVRADDKQVTLVRNHERRGSSGPFGAPDKAYDVVGGGTVTMHIRCLYAKPAAQLYQLKWHCQQLRGWGNSLGNLVKL